MLQPVGCPWLSPASPQIAPNSPSRLFGVSSAVDCSDPSGGNASRSLSGLSNNGISPVNSSGDEFCDRGGVQPSPMNDPAECSNAPTSDEFRSPQCRPSVNASAGRSSTPLMSRSREELLHGSCSPLLLGSSSFSAGARHLLEQSLQWDPCDERFCALPVVAEEAVPASFSISSIISSRVNEQPA